MSSPEPPSQTRVTDEDLIKAVRQQCERAGIPVVPTSQVAEAKHIDVTEQTVKRRLDKISTVNSIKVGRGKVWWVPEDEQKARGEVDMEAVYLENLDPEDLPAELVRKHPEGRPVGWRAWKDHGEKALSFSIIVFFAGFLIYVSRDIALLPLASGDLEFIGAIGFVGGIAVGLVSLLFTVIATLLDAFDVPALRLSSRLNEYRDRLADWIATN